MEAVLERVERRLLACDAFESLWHLQRMDDGEKALLVRMELSTGTTRSGRTLDETVAA